MSDLGSLEAFLRGRLRTAGLVAAGIAAAACAQGRDPSRMMEPNGGSADPPGNGGRPQTAELVQDEFWSLLDAETDARTPSPAQREASRRQGRALLRAARVAWPEAGALADLAAWVRAAGAGAPSAASMPRAPGAAGAPGAARPEYRGGPHHAVVLGAAAAAAGCEPAEAARIAAYHAVAGPVSAAVRLLALDPMRATGVLARLAGEIDRVAGTGAAHAGGPLDDLPSASAPALDLLAEAHIAAEVRLFES